jgi:ABC-2 type transport system ATP-binding protein
LNRLVSIDVSHALEVKQLEVDYGSLRALSDVSLDVAYGEVVALLGPNGAGKTTLVETLLGFRAPTAGTVRVHGLDPRRDHREVVVRTGALLQRGGVWAPMSPRDVLRLTASYYDAPRDVAELIALLGLETAQKTPWRRLSGGEQQRTLLALALLGRPKALLLDEPTTAVDPEGRLLVRDLLASERERGCAILVTTHELAEAERYAQRLVVLHEGRVLVQGTLDELIGEPEMIVQSSGPVNPASLADALHCSVTEFAPLQLRCAVVATPERIAIVTNLLASLGLSMVSLRTRASLEERYLELIGEQRSGARP